MLSALALATLVNVISILWSWLRVRAHRHQDQNQATRKFSILRLPAAVLASSRIFAFRYHLPLGTTFSMSLFETFITLAYLAALLAWEFVHSASWIMSTRQIHLITHDL